MAPSVPQNQTTASMPKPVHACTGTPCASRKAFTLAMRSANHALAAASGGPVQVRQARDVLGAADRLFDGPRDVEVLDERHVLGLDHPARLLRLAGLAHGVAQPSLRRVVLPHEHGVLLAAVRLG